MLAARRLNRRRRPASGRRARRAGRHRRLLRRHLRSPAGLRPMFGLGVGLIGFGGGLFAHGTLTASMALARPEDRGLALGAWGAAQATAAGLAIASQRRRQRCRRRARGQRRFRRRARRSGYRLHAGLCHRDHSLVCDARRHRAACARWRRFTLPEAAKLRWRRASRRAQLRRSPIMSGAILHLDVAQIVLYAFFALLRRPALLPQARRPSRGLSARERGRQRIQVARFPLDPAA